MINDIRHILVGWLLRLVIALEPNDEEGLLLIRSLHFWSAVSIKRLKLKLSKP